MPPTARVSQTRKAYDAIRSDIIRRVYPPGYTLSEVELAEKLGMSRTPVREALSQLRTEGLLARTKRGTIVKLLTRDEIRQAYEFAEALEAMAAWLAASGGAGKKDFAKMEKAVAGMEAAFEHQDFDAWAEADDAFHEALHVSCANKYILHALNSIYGDVYYTRMLVTKMLLDKALSTREHRETLEKIKAGDAAGARDLMGRHWSRIRGEVVRLIVE